MGVLRTDGLMKVKLRSVRELASMCIDVGEWIPALRLMLAVACNKIASDKEERKELKKEIVSTTMKYADKFTQNCPSNESLTVV